MPENIHKLYGTQYSQPKGTKTEQHVNWLDLANAYGFNSAPLNPNGPSNFLKLPLARLGKIIMKILQFSFSWNFTVKDYTTKWLALEIGIMMSLYDFPHFFFIWAHGTHIMRCSKSVGKEWWKNEHLTLPQSRAFYGRHHHSSPIPNCCRWFTTYVL